MSTAKTTSPTAAADRTSIELLAARYAGEDVPATTLTPTIERQLAHRSVRAFTDDDVSEEQLAAIVAAASSASSSSNQQWWSVIAIRDPRRKEAVSALSGRQDFIRRAPVFLVWVADLSRAGAIAAEHSAPVYGFPFLETTLTAVIDTALAAQNAAIAAESLGLGITYVGGVRNHPIDIAELLELPPHAFAVFGLAVGNPDPAEQADVRPRLPQSIVLHRETYRPAAIAELARHDDHLRAYFSRFGQARGWFEAVLARIKDPAGLHGRHRIREHLRELGIFAE